MAEFFLNYTRANNDKYLQRFASDLREFVRDRRGLAKTDDVDFFDQQDIELGAEWDRTIAAALQTVRSVVSVASPAFFKSVYCGRERALFRRRFTAGHPAPPLIKPIVWIPFSDAHVPPAFSAAQFTFGDPDAVHNTRGVKYMLQQIQKYRTDYRVLICELGEQLIAAADRNPIPPLGSVPPLASVRSEWDTPGAIGATAMPITGPKHVRFVYFAFHPSSVGPARLKEPYLETGGVDWKPFYPDTTPIHLFAQKTAISDELGFTSDHLPFGADLIEQIGTAWEARQIVVIVIDPWSLHWDVESRFAEYQQLLKTFDSTNHFHSCVLVPWNDQDPDLRDEPQRSAIESTMAATFPFHGRLNRNPMFFRDGIRNLKELKEVLAEVLPRLKEEIRKQAEVRMPIPDGPAKVVMSASPAPGQ